MKYLDNSPLWFRYDKQITPAWEREDGVVVWWDGDVNSYFIKPQSKSPGMGMVVEITKCGCYYNLRFPLTTLEALSSKDYLSLLKIMTIAKDLYPHFEVPTYLSEEVIRANKKRKSKFPPNHQWGLNA